MNTHSRSATALKNHMLRVIPTPPPPGSLGDQRWVMSYVSHVSHKPSTGAESGKSQGRRGPSTARPVRGMHRYLSRFCFFGDFVLGRKENGAPLTEVYPGSRHFPLF